MTTIRKIQVRSDDCAAEAVQRAEHPQEHLLRQIERLFAVAQEMGGEPEHQTVMLEDERRVRECRLRRCTAR